MANPVFEAIGNKRSQPDMAQQFQRFMEQMRGQNPQQILNDLVESGKVSQQQLDAAQKQAQQMQGMFNGMRNMFGF